VLTDSREAQIAGLRKALEEQYQFRTEQLTELAILANDGSDVDPETTRALTASYRDALADVARALRLMAEGRYGVCAGCQQDIPIERLEVLPQARLCAPCQRRTA
jgi:DnaK suppressor protein